MSLHDIISWVQKWTDSPTIGHMVDVVPCEKKIRLEKFILEQDELLQRLYFKKNPQKEKTDGQYEYTLKTLKMCQSNISNIGHELFGTTETNLLNAYSERIEYINMHQQYSVTHPVYIISEHCKDSVDCVIQYLDRMFTMYNEGCSELHTIISPFELTAPQWIVRECFYGWAYHHPSYIAYRIQSLIKDRPYTHLMTNCISPYLKYHPTHKVEGVSLETYPETRIMYMHTEYNYELTPEHAIQALEYDTPICIWGILPYFTHLLPQSIFQFQIEYVFTEDEAFPVFIIRGVYVTLDDTIQKHMSNDTFIKELDTKKELTYDMFSTCTLSILPDEWKASFFDSDYYLVKVTHFSWNVNAFLTKRLNYLLYAEHPNPKIN